MKERVHCVHKTYSSSRPVSSRSYRKTLTPYVYEPCIWCLNRLIPNKLIIEPTAVVTKSLFGPNVLMIIAIAFTKIFERRNC